LQDFAPLRRRSDAPVRLCGCAVEFLDIVDGPVRSRAKEIMNKTYRIAIVNADAESAEAVRQAAEIGDSKPENFALDEPDAVVQFLDKNAPMVVFFGIDEQPEAALDIVRTYTQAHAKSAVVAITNRASSELLLEAVRAGVEEFLTPPLDVRSVREAARNVCRKKGFMQADSSGGEGKLITFFSGKGGCGKTILAVNLACELAALEDLKQNSMHEVVLVDLSLQFGNAATLLDLQPKHSILDCIDNGGVDEELLSRLVCRHQSGVCLIPGPDDPADAEQVRPEQVQALLHALRKRYSFVIVDTSSRFDEHNLSALDMSDKIILVTDSLVPSVRNTQRCLAVFSKLGYDLEKLILIVNRFDKRVGAGRKELQQAFDLPIAAFLPNEFNAVMNAVDTGVPLAEVASKSEVAQAVKRLALTLAGTIDVPEETGWLTKLTTLLGK